MKLDFNKKMITAELNIECVMFIVNKNFFQINFNAVIKTLKVSIAVSEIDLHQFKLNEYIILDMFINVKNNYENFMIAHI